MNLSPFNKVINHLFFDLNTIITSSNFFYLLYGFWQVIYGDLSIFTKFKISLFQFNKKWYWSKQANESHENIFDLHNVRADNAKLLKIQVQPISTTTLKRLSKLQILVRRYIRSLSLENSYEFNSSKAFVFIFFLYEIQTT